jgi:hypothetical protein
MQWLLAIAALAILGGRRPAESAPASEPPSPPSPAPPSPKTSPKKDESDAAARVFDVGGGVFAGAKYVKIIAAGIGTLGAAAVPVAWLVVAIVAYIMGRVMEPAIQWRYRRNWMADATERGYPAWLGRQAEVEAARQLAGDDARWRRLEYREPAWDGRSGAELQQDGWATVYAREVPTPGGTTRLPFGVPLVALPGHALVPPPPSDARAYYDWLSWRRSYPAGDGAQAMADACAAIAQSVADGAWLGAAVAVALGESRPLPAPVTVGVYGPGVQRGVFAGIVAAESLPRVPEAHAAGYLRAARQVYREWRVEGGALKLGDVGPEAWDARVLAAYETIMGVAPSLPATKAEDGRAVS